MTGQFETTVTIGDKDVVVRELSVREVRNMSRGIVAGQTEDPLAGWLIEDAPFTLLAAMSDVSVDDLEEWRPSEIRKLAEKCREVNPDFFGMNDRLSLALRKINTDN